MRAVPIMVLCISADVDPVFPLTFLVNSWIPGVLDTIFQATFLSALLLYWLCIYHGVRQVSCHLVSLQVNYMLLLLLLFLRYDFYN